MIAFSRAEAAEGNQRLSPELKRTPGAFLSGGVTREARIKSDLDADTLSRIILASLEDDKAEDILALDIRGKSSFADMLVVASGRSGRHVGALADHLTSKLKEAGVKEVGVEGMPHCDWVLVDAGDVVVHLFRPEVRTFYNIEKIWAGAPAPGTTLPT